MRRFKFEISITVDGSRSWSAGDRADESEIPAGCLESMLRLGQVTEITAGPAAAELFVGFMEGPPAEQPAEPTVILTEPENLDTAREVLTATEPEQPAEPKRRPRR